MSPTGTEGAMLDLWAGHEAGRPVDQLVLSAARAAGLRDPGVWLVDLQERYLVPFAGSAGEELSVEGTLAGRAWREGSVLSAEPDPAGTQVWVPLRDGDDRIAVLGGTHSNWDPGEAQALRVLGAATGTLLGAGSAVSDSLHRSRRRFPVSLAAEMQVGLLPPKSHRSEGTTIAGALEPAYDIGGDSFDYAVDAGTAHLGLFDAMGHGLGAAAMVVVAVSAYRHARRCGADLDGCYEEVDQAVAAQFGPDRFVTGVLGRLDCTTGELEYIVAGHHPGLVLRAGSVVHHLADGIRLPFGLGRGLGPVPYGAEQDRVPARESLEPGDRAVFYTDGVIEARDESGDFFGLERLEELLVRADASATPPAETLRRLVRAVLDHQGDHLQDDATLLMVEWRRRS